MAKKKEEEQQGNHKRFIAQTARSRVRNRVNANSNINEEMTTATSQVHPNYPGDRTNGRTEEMKSLVIERLLCVGPLSDAHFK